MKARSPIRSTRGEGPAGSAARTAEPASASDESAMRTPARDRMRFPFPRGRAAVELGARARGSPRCGRAILSGGWRRIPLAAERQTHPGGADVMPDTIPSPAQDTAAPPAGPADAAAYGRALIAETKRRLFKDSMPRIRKCLAHLTEAEIWHRPNAEVVSVGNLV